MYHMLIFTFLSISALILSCNTRDDKRALDRSVEPTDQRDSSGDTGEDGGSEDAGSSDDSGEDGGSADAGSSDDSGEDGGSEEIGYRYSQPDSSICDASKKVSGGYLCAIKPSRLDAKSKDVYNPLGDEDDKSLGFGYHVVVFPDDGSKVSGVYVHFVGPQSRPYDQKSGAFPDELFLTESVSSGFLMIQPAFSNRHSLNNDDCGKNLGFDNCAEIIRKDKLTGNSADPEDYQPSTIEDTPLEDSLNFRMKKIVTYLSSKGFEFPISVVEDEKVNWQDMHVGGHSEGGGYALFLADSLGVKKACLLAGAHDINDEFGDSPYEISADWMLNAAAKPALKNVQAVLCKDDALNTGSLLGLSHFGLEEDVSFVSLEFPAPYVDSDGKELGGLAEPEHYAPLQDPRFASARKKACFDAP